jgi:hypothetical protein
MPRLVDCAPNYFESGYVICSECHEEVDLWEAALCRASQMHPSSTWALTSLGAAQTSFNMEMETGRIYLIDLTKYGIPANARILSRRCASQGGPEGHVDALEWHPSDPTYRVRGTTLSVIAVPLMEGPIPRTGLVAVSVAWIRDEDSPAWPYLVTAFEAAAAQDYSPGLVFAQCAIEISMMPFIEDIFAAHAPQKAVRRFTSYYRALHVILPYLCGQASIAKMPDSVLSALEKLRDKRNQIIHKGATALTYKDATEGLCAAAFGFEYMRYVKSKLTPKEERES